MKTSLLITTLTLSTLLAFIGSFFLNLTATYPERYLAVCTVIFADGFFGIWAGTLREGFKTYKALKILKTLVFWIVALTVVLGIEKAWHIGGWISETIIVPFMVFQIISVLKNASMAGFLNHDVISTMLNRIDLHKGIVIDSAQASIEDINNKDKHDTDKTNTK